MPVTGPLDTEAEFSNEFNRRRTACPSRRWAKPVHPMPILAQCASVVSRDCCLRDADTGERLWFLLENLDQDGRQAQSQRFLAHRRQQPFRVCRLFADLLALEPNIVRRIVSQNPLELIRTNVSAELSEDGSQLGFFIVLTQEVDAAIEPGTVRRRIAPVERYQPVTANQKCLFFNCK